MQEPPGDIRGLLIDLDGVIYTGESLIEGAGELPDILEERRIPYLFVSNSTRRCRASIVARLSNMGFRTREERILTPAIVAAGELQRRGIKKCHLLATGDVWKDFFEAGVEPFGESADVVVVADAGDNFTYERLTKAFRMLLDGAELIALEHDRYWMGADGLMLSAGPFVSALEYASGVTASVVGKPSNTFFIHALHLLGIEQEYAAMVGDDIATDIGGAKACGMMGILIRTGKYLPAAVERAKIPPDIIIESIAELPRLL
ncbi:MAG: TIGR01458 family HAD-type hydrolase [Methanomicrobiales archaeon]|nr:TIGR01458 family HAD-type hydrolase [Methanomicrobiales archaeon]